MVRVLPDVPALDRAFDYLVPPELDADVRVGSIVRVPLHGRSVGGWVVGVDVRPPAAVQLRPLSRVTGWGPPAAVVDLARWAAWRWAGRLRPLLRAASPPGAVRGLPPPPPPRPPGFGAEGADDLAGEAFARRRAVVRLPPAADPVPFAAAAAGRGDALVLVPSVAQASVLARRLARAGVPVAVLPREWARAAAGGCVAVGARAAAWAPLPAVAAVVVLDAHDESYQEERAPTWSAWVVAAERAERAGAPCVLVSPCPRLEQLAWGELVVASRGAERAGWAAVDVVDRRKEDPRAGLFSDRLVALVRSGRRVACVLNRKGRARLLSCAACGELARCERCRGAVSQEAAGLSCPRCGAERPVVCTECGGARLRTLRAGVARVREELEALAGRAVGEVTGDTGDVPATDVLVGTEAVLHRAGAVDAVAFLDFDQELLAPRFRASEEALALLARASRLVGGRKGNVVVQTRMPRHEVLDAALHADPGRLAGIDAARRTELALPPATAMAVVSGEAGGEYVAGLPATVEVLGPTEARWLVRAGDHGALCDALASTPRPEGRLRVEVDPPRA